jgi:predicted small metal-binding protein
MRRITCSDLGFGACKHVIEAVRDEELLERARAHVREKHGVELDEDVARRLLAATAADAARAPLAKEASERREDSTQEVRPSDASAAS